jgi:hypothetical protein
MFIPRHLGRPRAGIKIHESLLIDYIAVAVVIRMSRHRAPSNQPYTA